MEAQRLKQRTNYDIEMMRDWILQWDRELLRYMDGRKAGSLLTLLDYFPEDYLMIVDESHVTFPQVRAMYAGDRSRKDSLVEYGFRLPAAYDNRPLKFEEFEERICQVICVSATLANMSYPALQG